MCHSPHSPPALKPVTCVAMTGVLQSRYFTRTGACFFIHQPDTFATINNLLTGLVVVAWSTRALVLLPPSPPPPAELVRPEPQLLLVLLLVLLLARVQVQVRVRARVEVGVGVGVGVRVRLGLGLGLGLG